jgi:hypothetical protein
VAEEHERAGSWDKAAGIFDRARAALEAARDRRGIPHKLRATVVHCLERIEVQHDVCRRAGVAQEVLHTAIAALASGNIEDARTSLDQLLRDENLPSALRGRVDVALELHRALECVHDIREAATLHVDPRTGLVAATAQVDSIKRRLPELETATARARELSLELSPGVVFLLPSNDELRRLEGGVSLFEAYERTLELVVKEVEAGKWGVAHELLSKFFAREDSEGSIFAGGGDKVLKAIVDGNEVEEARRLSSAALRAKLTSKDLSHPLLRLLRAERDRTEGEKWARLRQLLQGCDQLAALARRQNRLTLAELIATPALLDPSAVSDVLAKKVPEWTAQLESRDVQPNKVIAALERALGADVVALFAVIGDSGRLAALPGDPGAFIHERGVAALVQMREKPAESDELVEWVVGASALLAASPSHRKSVIQRFGELAPAELAKEVGLADALAKTVGDALSAVDVAWGERLQPETWAFAWEIERQAVRALAEADLPEATPGPGPRLALRLGSQRSAALLQLVRDRPPLRRAFGPMAGAELLIRRGHPSRALSLLEPSVFASRGCLAIPAQLKDRDRESIRLEALYSIVNARLIRGSKFDDDTQSLPERVEQFTRALIAERGLGGDPHGLQRLSTLFAKVTERLFSLGRSVTEQEAHLVYECIEAAMSLPEAHDILKPQRAKLAFTLVNVIGPRYWQESDPAAKQVVGERLLALADTAVADSGSREPACIILRLTVQWAIAHGDPEREDQVRKAVEDAYTGATATPNWLNEFRELRDFVWSTDSTSEWVRNLDNARWNQ